MTARIFHMVLFGLLFFHGDCKNYFGNYIHSSYVATQLTILLIGLVKISWCFFQAATAEVVNGPPMKTWRLGPRGGFNGGLNGNQ